MGDIWIGDLARALRELAPAGAAGRAEIAQALGLAAAQPAGGPTRGATDAPSDPTPSSSRPRSPSESHADQAAPTEPSESGDPSGVRLVGWDRVVTTDVGGETLASSPSGSGGSVREHVPL